jgi:hypothetical protein
MAGGTARIAALVVLLASVVAGLVGLVWNRKRLGSDDSAES